MPVSGTCSIQRCCSGDALFQSGKHDEAVMRYTCALQSLPSSIKSGRTMAETHLYLHRSVAFRQLGHWKLAEQDAVKAVEVQPWNTTARCNWVICLNLLHRWPEALRACDIGLMKQPRSSALLRLRSEVLREQQTETFESDVPGCKAGLSMPPPCMQVRAGAAEPGAGSGNLGEALALRAPLTVVPVQMAKELLPRRDAQEAVQAHSVWAHSVWAKRSQLLRRSKFTRKMSLWWRLCRSELPGKQAPRQQMDDLMWKKFTPTIVNMERCNARTWNAGRGGQCSKAKCGSDSDFCRAHMADEKWRNHGRVDGPIPVGKLREFMRTRAPAISVRERAACDSRRKRTSARRQQQQVAHVGNHVRVWGDGQGGGRGSYVGLVVEESADRTSFTISTPPARESWSKRRVLKRYCALLQEKHLPSSSPLFDITKKRLPSVLGVGGPESMHHLACKKRCLGAGLDISAVFISNMVA